jgi:Outer membrane protein beta-barrel domain
MIEQPTNYQSGNGFLMSTGAKVVAVLLIMTGSSVSLAQDVRYSWFDVSFVQQDVSQTGSITDPALSQTVDVDTTDGDGIKFRGSFGTWHNLFAFVDFSSSDIAVDALVTNDAGQFAASDEFDFTSIRGGVGLKWSISTKTDLYGAVSYDSTDFDFGSFAGEDFDTGEKSVGGEIGVRSMFSDHLELRLRARYTGVGAVDLSTGEFGNDTLFGVGFGYELVRGLSFVGDFESGEFSSWNIGFRLDLSED